tara:strand:+ start:3303 stop:3974 length:672 start_codon:yes stop_codon:yes gene_type:complete
MTLIFTADDTPYMGGDVVVMHKTVTYPPTAPNTTYILHPNKIVMSDLIEWLPLISYRLVVVTDKKPTIPKGYEDEIVIHPSLNKAKENHFNAINPIFRWSDRLRVLNGLVGVPMPLILAFLKSNRKTDIETFRRLAQATYTLPEIYSQAILAYSVQPISGRVEWPKKKPKTQERDSTIFRDTDLYADIISLHAEDVLNVIRVIAPTEIPKGKPKGQTSIVEWL